MSFSTYSSIRRLIQTAESLLPGKNVVSFDLFDTLLVRRIHDPDLVKNPVAKYISTLAQQEGINILPGQVSRLRDEIEGRQRIETGKNFRDHEACYPAFMSELLQTVFGGAYIDTHLERVTEYELRMENSMLVPRHEFVEWIKELHRRNKRLLIISDMYLPASHLEKLVAHAGLQPYIEAVISSADTFLAKASGEAYKLLKERFSIEPGRWLHIGDNPISDGLRAVDAGLEALIIQDPRESQRISIMKRYYNYSAGKPFWRGRALQQLMSPLEAENSYKSDLYIEGYNFVGPLVGTFIQRLAEHCQKDQVTKIFFLSREGWTFKKYWEAVQPYLFPAGGQPECEYLYVSRMALAGASCAYQGLTKTNAEIAFLPPGNRDFRDICRIFALEEEKFIDHLARHGLRLDSCLSILHEGFRPEHQEFFQGLLADEAFQGEVRRQTRPANEAMQRYFSDAGLFAHERVAIVDIGWLGTIQRFLFEAIAHRSDCPNCFGYLFGATRGIQYPTSEKNRVTGLIYDKDRFDFAASTIFYARDIFEEACRAPHPTLNGYGLKGDDGYELLFRRTDDDIGTAELEQDRYFIDMQQGILESAARYGAASAVMGCRSSDYKAWFNYLMVCKFAFPAASEVATMRNKHHLDDFHGRKTPKKSFSKNIKCLWDSSSIHLRFNPLIRLYHFYRHLRTRITE